MSCMEMHASRAVLITYKPTLPGDNIVDDAMIMADNKSFCDVSQKLICINMHT